MSLVFGGGIVYVSVENFLEFDGLIKVDGSDGDIGRGGVSGGIFWVVGRYFEGYGYFIVRGGKGSYYFYCCSGNFCYILKYYYGGGGGGGYFCYFLFDYIRRDVIWNRDVFGGVKGGGSVGSGYNG